MHLLVGLGNPGAQYDGTRHNVGFAVVDALAATFATENFRRQKKNLVARARISPGGHDVLLVKPQTFMNLSADGVLPRMQFYKVPGAHLVVIHDELDFPCGRVRLKPSGGHGGHNGLRHLLQVLPEDFVRVRVGIGKARGQAGQVGHVLGQFAGAERRAIDEAVACAAAASAAVVSDGLQAAMNRFNQDG